MARLDHPTRTDGLKSELGCGTRAKRYAASSFTCATRFSQKHQMRCWPMTVMGVRRDKAALSSGCKSHPAIAPAGSSRSSYGGDEIAEAFGMRVTNW
jgi:hypothetical protein